ncbi:dihydrofolate reductase [Sphingosinicella terrae]|uniref:dihydrofolate reductase n=1 Tax=Sphingosinicella terrae TaxID=2172047 RepID=UPI000E0D8E23|nr:dihydrofolate reductase [Sphingosinicella terrae]
MSRSPEIVFYLARATNGVIGKDGRLPWHLSADLKRYKTLTMGKPMVMGRRTFESFGGPLPGRRHIVLTRSPDWRAEGAETVHDRDAAIALAGDVPEIAIVGGTEIFRLFLDEADRIELTEVHLDAEGDTFMPAFDPKGWRESWREDHPAEDGRPAFSFVRLVRRDPRSDAPR